MAVNAKTKARLLGTTPHVPTAKAAPVAKKPPKDGLQAYAKQIKFIGS